MRAACCTQFNIHKDKQRRLMYNEYRTKSHFKTTWSTATAGTHVCVWCQCFASIATSSYSYIIINVMLCDGDAVALCSVHTAEDAVDIGICTSLLFVVRCIGGWTTDWAGGQWRIERRRGPWGKNILGATFLPAGPRIGGIRFFFSHYEDPFGAPRCPGSLGARGH